MLKDMPSISVHYFPARVVKEAHILDLVQNTELREYVHCNEKEYVGLCGFCSHLCYLLSEKRSSISSRHKYMGKVLFPEKAIHNSSRPH